MKVLFMTNIPSPYRVEFFNVLGELCDLTVLFERKSAKSRDSKWENNQFKNFNAIFLKGKSIGEAEAICPEVIMYLSKKKYDVIVVGMYSSPTGMLAIEYMKLRKISFILSSDGGIKGNESSFKRRCKSHFISAASAWLSTGSVTREYLCWYGAKSDKIYIYPFTSIKNKDIIHHLLTSEQKRAIRNNLGIIEKEMILSVGQFIPRKGYDLLLKACEKLSKKTGVYIVGGEPTKEYLKLQSELNLTNVHFVGFKRKEELEEYYKAADLFVLPTREDIWGLVINEAMAYGLPVVTTDKCVAGIEMIRNGENGYIVPAGNIEKLAEAILRSKLLDPCKAIETARRYTIEQMAEKHMECFEKFVIRRKQDE